jgi:hypothetical protein
VSAGWWRDRPDEADVNALLLDELVVIEWDLASERMRVRTWTPAGGERVADRPYA